MGISQCNNISIEFNIIVTDEDIDDIMIMVLEDGITYWCNKAEVVGNYLGEFASEQISRGGELKLYYNDSGEFHLLTKDVFLSGIKMYLQDRHNYGVIDDEGDRLTLDTGMIDVNAADSIIQFGLFGEIRYA